MTNQRWRLQQSMGLIGLLLLCGARANGAETFTDGAQTQEHGAEAADASSDQPSGAGNVAAEGVSEDGGPLRIAMNLQDAQLRDVLKVFSQQSQLNIIAAKEIEDQRVTLFLKDVGVQDALSQILRANNLVAERLPDSDIYVVKRLPAPVESGPPPVETITRIYKLKYAHVSNSILQGAMNALVRGSSPFEASQARLLHAGSGSGTAIGGGSGTSVAGSSQGIDHVIERLLTESGKLVADDRTNSLIITDVPANFPRLEAAIQQLDVATKQVLIEVEVVETTLGKAKHLGIEWGTGNEGTLLSITPASANTTFPFQYRSGWFGLFRSAGNRSAGAPVATAGTQGTVGTNNLLMTLKALEQDTDTRILARPRVMTLDQQSAVIRLTENTAISINSTTTTGGATSTATTVERSLTGIILSVTPQINADGTVTMLVEPTINRPVASSLTNAGQAVLNPKERSARAVVRIKEGNTFVLGGLIDRQEKTALRKVPVLGDIPLIGGAFRKLDVDNSDTELLVFITPHILREDRLAADVSMDLRRSREQEGLASREAVIENALNTQEQQRRYPR